MEMNESHPDFDMAMELLCSIPPYPSQANMANLALDLGFSNQKEIRPLLATLKERGFVVESRRENGFVVAILPQHWQRAKRAAEAYWQKVNGERKAAA